LPLALEFSISFFDTGSHLFLECHKLGGDCCVFSADDLCRENPGVAAPALPMAMVATGMPAGIWTVASRASRPLRLDESIGMPITAVSCLPQSHPPDEPRHQRRK
jgi:hypothetical protein